MQRLVLLGRSLPAKRPRRTRGDAEQRRVEKQQGDGDRQVDAPRAGLDRRLDRRVGEVELDGPGGRAPGEKRSGT